MLIIGALSKQGKAMPLTKKVQTLNHYVFLLIALFVMFLVLKEFVRKVFHEDYEPPKVQVIEEANQQLTDISYSKHFLNKLDDVYIFSIKVDKITLQNNPIASLNNDSASSVLNLCGGEQDDRRVVNFMFAKDNNKDRHSSEDAQQDVYISNYDGSGLKLVFSNVSSMHLEDENLLYLTQGSDIEELTYFYLVDEGRLVQLDTTL